MNYKTLRNIIITILGVYFIVGISAHFLDERSQSPYPFFSWFLFHEVPNEEKIDYTLLIHELGEEEFNPALPFEKVEGLYSPDYPTTFYTQLIRNMARNVENDSDYERLKNEIESHFLKKPVVYELSRVKYNLIERWKSGELISSSTIHVFTTEN